MAKKRRKSGNTMKRRLNGSIQGKRAMHRARQKAKYKRQAQQRRNSNPNYYYKPNHKTNQISDDLWIVIGAIAGFIIFAILG